jgi:hypothetical protein
MAQLKDARVLHRWVVFIVGKMICQTIFIRLAADAGVVLIFL